MIWYELSKGKLSIPDPKKYILVCTHLSLMELAFTKNIIKNYREVQDTIKFIMASKPNFIMYNPYVYAKASMDPKFKLRKYKPREDLLMPFLKAIYHNKEKDIIDKKLKNYHVSILYERSENANNFANFRNDLYVSVKRNNYVFKKYNSIEADRNMFRKLFLHTLNHFQEKKDNLNSNLNWSEIELFEKVSTRYLKRLIISSLKVDKNDDNDLNNMIYVSPTDKYWTLEKRWIHIIKEINLSYYLYFQN